MVSRKEDLENGGGWNVRKGKKKAYVPGGRDTAAAAAAQLLD